MEGWIFYPLLLLLTMYRIVPTLSHPGQNERIIEDNDRELRFKDLSVMKGDCNEKKTAQTLEFLKGELKGKHVDCATKLTELYSLRRFLEEEGQFLKGQMGSVKFINAQDHVIKMDCTDHVKDGYDYRWRAELSEVAENFNKEGYVRPRLIMKAPPDHEYYRRITCYRITTDKAKRCRHVFHIITRPLPKVTFPLQFSEGSKAEMSCELSPCLYQKCEEKVVKKNPQPPYYFLWVLPSKLTPMGPAPAPHEDCQDGLESEERIVKPYYNLVSPNKTVLNLRSETRVEIEAKDSIGVKNDMSGKTSLSTVRTNLTIDSVKLEHRGNYECVIVDSNGVPSMPSFSSLDEKIIYSGRVFLHVRSMIWTILPAGILGGMLVLVVAIQFLCPLRMEYDDGTPYTKQQLVAPMTEASGRTGPAPATAVAAPKK